MRRYLMGSVFATVFVLSISLLVIPRLATRLSAETSQAAASTAGLTGIWAPPRTPKGFLPYSFSPEAPPPMQPWAAKRCDAVGCGKGQLGRAVDDSMDPYITSCAPFGIPRVLNNVAPFEILQTPGRVLMLFEAGNSLRQIWTDGRGHPGDLDSTW